MLMVGWGRWIGDWWRQEEIKERERQSNSVSNSPAVLCTGYDPHRPLYQSVIISCARVCHQHLCALTESNNLIWGCGEDPPPPFCLFFPPHVSLSLDEPTSQSLPSKNSPKLSNGKSISQFVKRRPHSLSLSLFAYSLSHTHTHTKTQSHTVICPPCC